MNVQHLAAFEQAKRDRDLLKNGVPVSTFTVDFTRTQYDRLCTLSADFGMALLRFGRQVLLETPGFPSFADLGFEPRAFDVLRTNRAGTPEEAMVIGRLDLSTDGERYFSYELNSVQPGTAEYWDLFTDPAFQALTGIETRNIIHEAFFGHALELYRRTLRTPGPRDQPRGILLVSYAFHFLDLLRSALERFFGQEVRVSEDGSDCFLEGDTLMHRGPAGDARPVDLVFRTSRVNFYELIDPRNAAMIEAWRRGAVVLANPPQSKVVGVKTIYAHLRDEKLLAAAGVTEAERHAIDQLLPVTRLLDATTAPEIAAHPEAWVIKGPLGGRGQVVFLGPETEPAAWRTLVATRAREAGWIAMEFQRPHRMTITLHDAAQTRVTVPISVEPYVVAGTRVEIPMCFCRAVVPSTDDPAELENVKMHIFNQTLYTASDGTTRERQIGFGYVRVIS